MISVLALEGDHSFGNVIINSIQTVDNYVSGGVVSNKLLDYKERLLDYLIKILKNFFEGNITTTTTSK